MTWPGIEPRSPRSLANTLPTKLLHVANLMVTVVEKGHGDQSLNPKQDCLPFSANTLRKEIQLFSLQLSLNSKVDWRLNLGMATSLWEGKLNSNLLNCLSLSSVILCSGRRIERSDTMYKLVTIVNGNPKATFSIAMTPRCRAGLYSFLWIAPLPPWYEPYNAECYARRYRIPFFMCLLNDSTWDWTIGKHSTQEANRLVVSINYSFCNF